MWLIKDLLLPPVSLFLILVVGTALQLRRFGLFACAVGLVGLALVGLSMPVVARFLLVDVDGVTAEGPPPLEGAGASAIVVFAGGALYPDAHPERDEPDQESWERLRGAAQINRATGLPIIVSGWSGEPDANIPSTAELMASVLHSVYGVPSSAMTVEPRARNTDENARFTASILRARSVTKAILVTHFWHMPRAQTALEHQGIAVVPAPVGFYPATRSRFVPNMEALFMSHLAIYEGVGSLWYRLVVE